MLYKNAYIYCDDFRFHHGSLYVENGKFTKIADGVPDESGIDVNGAYIIPGFIDIHNHGNSGVDFSEGNYDSLKIMAAYLAKHGITSFTPASMTLPYDVLETAFDTAKRLNSERPDGCAKLQGINMEGPFFSEKKKGAQNGKYLKLPDYESFSRLNDGCGRLVKIVDIAPELEGAVDFIGKAKDDCTVSVAHTDADYDHAKAAFDAGATHVTHLFNAMPSLHHRNPGVIGAAAENKSVLAELICDGIHIHPSVIRMAFSAFGADRICLISDALSCCGMDDGEYMLGGQKVFVKGKLATLADSTIAGSASNLADCVRTAVGFGIKKEDAIRAATYNPAKAINALDRVGSISTGKDADFIICDPQINISDVFIDGKPIE